MWNSNINATNSITNSYEQCSTSATCVVAVCWTSDVTLSATWHDVTSSDVLLGDGSQRVHEHVHATMKHKPQYWELCLCGWLPWLKPAMHAHVGGSTSCGRSTKSCTSNTDHEHQTVWVEVWPASAHASASTVVSTLTAVKENEGSWYIGLVLSQIRTNVTVAPTVRARWPLSPLRCT